MEKDLKFYLKEKAGLKLNYYTILALYFINVMSKTRHFRLIFKSRSVSGRISVASQQKSVTKSLALTCEIHSNWRNLKVKLIINDSPLITKKLKASGCHIGQTDTSAYDLFQANLIEAGYLFKEQYDKPVCILNNRKFFEVSEYFPCIMPKDLSEGISKVRYRIDVNSCEEFLVTKDEFLRSISNGNWK